MLETLCDDVDLSPEDFPYMGVREGHVAGIPTIFLRVGFVGELGYELHVPASQGEALWDALMEAGAAHGIRPFGVEAQRLLRLEKGHILIGQDTDGLTTPHEADMAWALAKKKPFHVGIRSVRMQAAKELTRKLVGFEMPGVGVEQPKECHLVFRGGEITGRVTSVAYSPNLDKIVGLAYVAPDQSEPGSQDRDQGGRRAHGERDRGEAAVLRPRRRAAGALSMTAPAEQTRRSPLYRALEAHGARFEALSGFAVAQDFGREAAAEAAQAESLGLADLTPLPRIGFKGWNIEPWLAGNGAELGAASNRAYRQADGTRIARLAPGEALVLADRGGAGPLIATLDQAWSMAEADGCFRVARDETSCWLLLTGAHAPSMLAKVCAVDLRPQAFAPDAIAQTNVARLNVIVIRGDIGPVPAFDLITDLASAVYLWGALLDAMAEYDGAPVGLAAIRALLDGGDGQDASSS